MKETRSRAGAAIQLGRLATCEACPSYGENPQRCAKLDGPLAYFISFDASACPDGKWMPTSPAAYPPLLTQVGNALAAGAAFVESGCATVDQAEFDQRHSICQDCEHFDAAQDRCRSCGCLTNIKLWMASEHCPLPEPKW